MLFSGNLGTNLFWRPLLVIHVLAYLRRCGEAKPSLLGPVRRFVNGPHDSETARRRRSFREHV
jgi:hypothetical protein